MSISVIASPSGKPSVQDELWHIVSSTNSGDVDFKYVFDIYVDGVQLVRVKQYPEPSNGKGYFNAAPIVQGTMKYDWFKPEDKIYLTSPDASGQISRQYNIRYGEEVSGITTLNMASGNTTAYNWRPPLFKRRIAGISDKDNKYVTNRLLRANCNYGEALLIGVHSNTAVTAVVTRYNASNQQIGPANNQIGTLVAGYFQLNISPDAINGTPSFGAGYIHSQVKYYTVTIDELNVTFRVDMVCDREYTPVPLHFMNQYGMFDTARFGLVSRLTMDVERKGFKQREYSFGASSVDYYDSYNVYRESKINYAQKADYSYKLTMDAIEDKDYEWLSELMMSPQIYAEIDGYFYPVTIKDSNYEFSKIINNRVRPLEINIELNQIRYSHVR